MTRPLRSALLVASLLLLCLPAEAGRRARRRPQAKSATLSEASIQDVLQRIIFYEDRRIVPAEIVVRYLSHPSSRVRQAAVLALGRNGDPSGLDEMARILTRKDVDLRIETAFALSLIPHDAAGKIISQNFPMHKDPETRAALVENMGRTGDQNTVALMAELLEGETNPRLLPAVYEGLGLLWSKDSESWTVPAGLLGQLTKAAQGKPPESTLAAFALARFKGEQAMFPVDEIVAAAAAAPSEFSRAFLLRVLGKIRTPASTAVLIKGAANAGSLPTRVEAVKALASHEPTPEVLNAVNGCLGDTYQHVVFEALGALEKFGPKAAALVPQVLGLWNGSRSPWIRGTALKTLAALDPKAARVEITRALTNPSSPYLADALGALGVIAEAADVATLTGYLAHSNIRLATAAAEALSLLEDDKFTPETKAALKKALERGDTHLTTVIAQTASQHQWKDFAPDLASAYGKLTQVEHLEAKVAVLGALGAVGDQASVPTIQRALADRERLVVEAAVKAITALTGKAPAARVPLNSKVDAPTPPYSAVRDAIQKKVILKTTRGEIHLRMLPEAPMTAYHFTRLVKQGFYSGKTFHRVVPNFVVQGGDPRGDGFGGPGFFIRDEVSRRKHERGTVGIATAGKDTGGSQFFINLAPNHHLNGRYTAFAEVVQGIAVADKLEVGDRVLSATLQ